VSDWHSDAARYRRNAEAFPGGPEAYGAHCLAEARRQYAERRAAQDRQSAREAVPVIGLVRRWRRRRIGRRFGLRRYAG